MTHHENHPPNTDSCSNGPQSHAKAHREHIDPDSIILSIATFVSEAVGKDLSELPPLYNSIDTDALATIFKWDSAESPQTNAGCVTFRYEECEVTIFADGQVVVIPPEK